MKDDAKPRHIGDIVRQLRISEGLTQKELARRSFFLSESTIRNIEKRGGSFSADAGGSARGSRNDGADARCSSGRRDLSMRLQALA